MSKRKFVRSGTGLNFPVPVESDESSVSGTTGASGTSGSSSSQNTDKNETSLALGSAGYREYLEDKAGIDEKDVVGSESALESGGPVGHMEINENARRESDEYQVEKLQPAGDHAVVLAGELREAAQGQRDADRITSDRKYRNRMAKLDKYDGIMQTLRLQAEATETTADDKKVAKLAERDCDDLPEIIDDGLTADDFMPRSLQKYL